VQLSQFQILIGQMPVLHQAFRSKRATWAPFEQHGAISGALTALFDRFGKNNVVFLSRADLFDLALSDDLSPFVLGTIIWGYPRGMRGNHFRDLLEHFDDILGLLEAARKENITDWAAHFRKTRPIRGIGLSTYTKFLHFLRVQVLGSAALILDDRLIQVARRHVFADLIPLSSISAHSARQRYPEYLSLMHRLAQSLNVNPHALEMFLFEFGLGLK
jgi:hypothetical protein